MDGSTDREAQMRAAGIERFTRRQDSLEKGGSFTETAYGRGLLADYLVPVADRLKAALDASTLGGKAGRPSKYLKLLGQLDVHLVAYLALSSSLSSITSKRLSARLAHSVCLQIGFSIYDELNWRGLKENDTDAHRKAKFARGRDRAYDVTGLDRPDPKDAAPLGALLLALLEEAGVVERITTNDKATHTQVEIGFAPLVVEAINAQRAKAGAGKFIGVNPIFRPLLERPKPWTSPRNGGYRQLRLPLVKGGRADLATADLSKVYQAVNAMQDVALAINIPIYNLVRKMWASSLTAGKLPSASQTALQGRLDDEAWTALTPEERSQRAAVQRQAKADNRQAASDSASIGQTIDMAEEIGAQPFWLPYQLDYRGRAYAVPLFNHQGPDWMRAMIDFAEGKALGERGAMWLGITLAGLWDGPQKLSKASFQDRYTWAEDNEELVRAVVSDPLGDLRWTDADKPWLFLRTAMDWVAYLDQGEDFVSYLPLALDGSCSGIQHYSAMLRDEQGGAQVNLIPSEVPADVYASVADDVAFLLQEAEACPERDWWLAHGITRKVTKKPVMTYGYSSRIPGFTDWYATEFVRPFARQHGMQDGINTDKVARYLAKLTLEAVEGRLVAVAGGMEWLQKCATLVSKQDTGLDWVTPDGLPVRQEIRKCPSVRVELALQGERLRVSIPGAPREVDKYAMASAIGPNFIHSMDAAHLRLCASRLVEHGITGMLFIHDSFGTLPADVDTLYADVRETFVEMYEDHAPLDDLYQAVQLKLPDDVKAKLPPPPATGNLDLRAVTESAYCFA